MGHGYYHNDVHTARQAIGTTRSSDSAFGYHKKAERGEVTGVHPDLNIHGKVRECRDTKEHPATTPIVVAMDVTGSRGRDARTVYEQVPSFLGALRVTQFVSDPEICWIGIGDATCDRAPLQVGQFESDRMLDQHLSNLWLEAGGGGSREESYELVAYALARKTELDATARGRKGFVFFTADEAPYAQVSPAHVERLFGDSLSRAIGTKQIFREMRKKFIPFLVYSKSASGGHDDSETVLGKWRQYIPKEHVLPIKDAASTVEAMLGAIALAEGRLTLDQFDADMKIRQVPDARRKDVLSALAVLAQHGAEVAEETFEQ